MKVLIAGQNRAFCLHLPLLLLCSRASAALLAGSLRRVQGPKSDSQETGGTGLITAAQVHGLLKVLRQSKRSLREAGLPLVDIEESGGVRIVVTL